MHGKKIEAVEALIAATHRGAVPWDIEVTYATRPPHATYHAVFRKALWMIHPHARVLTVSFMEVLAEGSHTLWVHQDEIGVLWGELIKAVREYASDALLDHLLTGED